MRIKHIIIFFFFIGSFNGFSQSISGIINSYAAVTSISTNTLGLSSVAGFAVGDKVLLIQMQGASINTANAATFGNITSAGTAGVYEFNFVGAINGSSVTLTCPVINTYSIGGAVQLVKVPVYTNATITNTLTALPWNGTTGGILAFESTTLTLNSDINVDALGFRGGTFSSGGFCCANNNYVSTNVSGGQKGESIAKYIVGMDCSRGKNASGGGGGNCGNSGGGGGGNGGAGGIGGNIYSGCGVGDQGVGGLSLTAPTTLLYMGGGGGGGFRDNGQSCTAGGVGGGIVFIISSQINCNSRVMSSAGANVTVNAVDEGSGGGGAGGSVYIVCPTYIGNLTIDTHGGKGGSNFNSSFPSDCHGPGGGGGGGVYAFSPAAIPGSVTHINNGGSAGLVLNPASGCFNTSYGGAAGSAGTSLPNLAIAVTIPTITIAGTNTVCTGSAVTLTASGSTSYTWSTAALTSTVSVTPVALTVYTVLGGAASCTNTATYTVSTINIPTLSVAGNFSVCAGAPTIITASGATTYTWNTAATTNTIIPAPIVTTVYTVSGTSASTCSSSATATITVTPSPTPTINNSSPVCIGQAINFNGGGGNTYSWNGPAGSGFSSAMQNPTIGSAGINHNGTYTLTVTDLNNCSTSTTQIVVVNPLPAVNTTGSTVCVNQNISLTANGGVAYGWTGPGGYFSAAQNPVIPSAALTMIGQYTVTVVDANTCSNTAVANVSVNPIPSPTVQSNSPVCDKQILSLNGSGSLNYSWTGPAGFTSAAQNPTLSVTTLMSGNYILTASDAIGCSGTASVNVIVNPLPSPFIISNINKGCSPLCVTFTCQSTTSLQACNWDFGTGATGSGTVTSYCYKNSSNYTVKANVTDMNNCSNSNTYTVGVYPVPVADFAFSPLVPVLNDGPVNFIDATYGANIISWNWYFKNTAAFQSALQNPTFVYTDAGQFQVVLVVKSDKGCRDTIMRSIVVNEDFGVYVPEAFTPNGDGLNDYFQPKGFGVTKYDIEIYDRWGEKVFHTADFNVGWDGKFMGRGDKILAEAVYVWKIKVTDVFGKSKTLTGHVTLIK